MAKVPFDAPEAELLSSAVPRGYKQLTTATSKLVKAGWLVKERSGWTATGEGVRALAAFPDADAFADAMVSGNPVPESAPQEAADFAAAHAQQAPLPLNEELLVQEAQDPAFDGAEGASAVDAAAADGAEGEADAAEGDAGDAHAASPVQPALVEAAASDMLASGVAAPDESLSDVADVDGAWQDQPQSVALAGDFNPLFGEAGHWTTNLHGLQLSYDAVENVWKQTLQLPAGTYQYKIVVNGSWDENYGAFGVRDGANHELRLLSDAAVTFRFNFATKDVETA
ncbi:glycosidase [Arthrobacter sp. Br18]|uniref:pullulanase X25 domain-containing protein n=1 Tax=Arthrobacter sp. Br18 TaxID=1312954 RepID=UPI0012DF1E9A|nr:glycosidase [Arthrobacter sp. Br18]